MTTLICFLTLVIGFLLGGICKTPLSKYFVEKINFAVGVENQTLKEENEDLKRKRLFFKDWFVRSYIEQYYRRNIAIGERHIYTYDALEELRLYAKAALDNFQNTWNSEICNEQCTWIIDYLQKLITDVDCILDDSVNRYVIDKENEWALQLFFPAVETDMFFDRLDKERRRERSELTYWTPDKERSSDNC